MEEKNGIHVQEIILHTLGSLRGRCLTNHSTLLSSPTIQSEREYFSLIHDIIFFVPYLQSKVHHKHVHQSYHPLTNNERCH